MLFDLAAFGVLLILAGGISIAFAALAILADVVLPAMARHTWRGRKIRQRVAAIIGQRPAATYRM
jgi:hypothetical protein